MAAVTVKFPVEDMEKATALAAAIREAGTLEYTNVEGNTVNVTVGDIEATA